jgi:hypothetical protein
MEKESESENQYNVQSKLKVKGKTTTNKTIAAQFQLSDFTIMCNMNFFFREISPKFLLAFSPWLSNQKFEKERSKEKEAYMNPGSHLHGPETVGEEAAAAKRAQRVTGVSR